MNRTDTCKKAHCSCRQGHCRQFFRTPGWERKTAWEHGTRAFPQVFHYFCRVLCFKMFISLITGAITGFQMFYASIPIPFPLKLLPCLLLLTLSFSLMAHGLGTEPRNCLKLNVSRNYVYYHVLCIMAVMYQEIGGNLKCPVNNFPQGVLLRQFHAFLWVRNHILYLLLPLPPSWDS